MKFLTVLLIVIVVLSCLFSTSLATTKASIARCDDCKNALRTVDSKLPGKRSREQIENYLQGACQQATAIVPLPELPISLPVPICSLITAHRSELVQGLIERKEYTSICKNAKLC
ncbi:hypothetical protein DDB_G0278347 [Dictyostelium discoideum AX4]|uniref:Saposin B-type domain-containing protein n=1 Tax=Dictyostelium discoideum TaxID=44689 RepID=Q54Y99_DICDI|nr:hypothetical protein DDB_G0278347 [Dictyostelium discoideum AX4]EAL68346.1 hypothetical protein DDB_G0278347 [Dictyostelium discoideum AX4]|eukprot:XP_642303.1 hypothetical protein DDB_G0278347 [Dictyostelium discoideum AX4]